MQTTPGTQMSDEPYTLTEAQINALNALPPGVYLVCSECRRFSAANTTIHFRGGGMCCDACVKGYPRG